MCSTGTVLSRSFPDRRKCWRNRISLFLQQIANFAAQRDIFGFRRWRLFLGFEHFASLTHDQKNDEGKNQEVDHHRMEFAPPKHGDPSGFQISIASWRAFNAERKSP